MTTAHLERLPKVEDPEYLNVKKKYKILLINPNRNSDIYRTTLTLTSRTMSTKLKYLKVKSSGRSHLACQRCRVHKIKCSGGE